MKTIAIVNQKGGVGKSTTALALVSGLARRGFKTLAVDLDGQGNLTYTAGAKRDGANSHDVLTGKTAAADAVQRIKTWDIIPASVALAGADMNITGLRREYRLRDALEPLEGAYDYIIIDTPPALGILTVNALTASDYVVVPAQADIFSLQGIQSLADTVNRIKERANSGLKVAGILMTRYNGRAILSRKIAEAAAKLAETLDTKVYDAKIRDAIAVKEAESARMDICDYAPKSTAAKDYEAFTDEFLKGVE